MRALVLMLTLAACSSGGNLSPDDAGAADSSSSSPSTDGAFATASHYAFPPLPMASSAGVITIPRIVTVSPPGDAAASDIAAFGGDVPGSAWFSAWSNEYGVGTARPSVAITGAALPEMPAGGYTEATMDSYVGAAITAASAAPTPDGHTLYVLLLPIGVFYEHDGSCKYDGYHSTFGGSGDGVAFVQRCGTPPFGVSDLDNLTKIASHEIAEAATDTGGVGWILQTSSTQPWTGNVWATADGSFGAEIGDMCGLQTRVVEDAYTYQRIYSNAALPADGDPCVPPLPLTYYNTSTAQGWYAGATGTTVAIPVTGWSSGPSDDWYVSGSTRVSSQPAPGFSYALSSPAERFNDAGHYHAMNNGQTQTLNVTIPPAAAHGSFISIMLLSSKLTSDGAYIPGEDFGHRWIVGVYVP
jgi:hypothetical protein